MQWILYLLILLLLLVFKISYMSVNKLNNALNLFFVESSFISFSLFSTSLSKIVLLNNIFIKLNIFLNNSP